MKKTGKHTFETQTKLNRAIEKDIQKKNNMEFVINYKQPYKVLYTLIKTTNLVDSHKDAIVAIRSIITNR